MKTETKIKAASWGISIATLAATAFVGYLIGRGATSLIVAARNRLIEGS